MVVRGSSPFPLSHLDGEIWKRCNRFLMAYKDIKDSKEEAVLRVCDAGDGSCGRAQIFDTHLAKCMETPQYSIDV